MTLSRENLPALALLLTVVVLNGVGLWPELSISRVDLNDNVFHYTLAERMVQAVERGENPLDCWSPEWSLGYPVLRTYQPLAHALVAGVYFALGKSVGLMTVFVWVRFLSVLLLPVSFFAAARMLELSRAAAAAAAMLAPMVSTNFLFGVEYGSFLWAGSGLFPQAVGCHFLLITLGLAWGAVRGGRRVALTGALLGLTFLAHLIYGYMAALSVCLLAAIPDAEVARWLRVRRAAMVGAVAALLAAFQLAPLVLDGANINHSRWEPVWKWDSFGPGQVMKLLFTGDLLDYGRLPVLTMLAFGGAAWFGWRRWKERPAAAGEAFAVWGAGFWLLVFCGRPLWGPVLTLLGVSENMQLHRVIGGVHIFLVLVAATGVGAVWSGMARRGYSLAAVVATLAVLSPMLWDRTEKLANNAAWGRSSLTSYQREQRDLEATVEMVKARGGRAYAGMATAWGGRFRVGDVPFYSFFSTANIPAVAFLYHAMALPADIMVRFNEWNPSHYRLFNIHTVVAPVTGTPALPFFVMPVAERGRFRIYEGRGNSYFDVVDAVASVKTTRRNYYEINDRWLQSDWVAKRAHLRLDWSGSGPAMPRLRAEDALPGLPPMSSPGDVRAERRNGDEYGADVEAARASFVLFKMTWHANWRATVDGRERETRMLSPGFVGVPVEAGRHTVVLRYRPEGWKPWLGFGGLAVVLVLVFVERGSGWPRVEAWRPRGRVPDAVRRRAGVAAGLVLLALPVCIPLVTGSVLAGHDGFVYFPRLVEFHQNIAHGVLLPRWAPDLGNGTGEPLFLFHPPAIYYLGELWHLAGFDFVTSMNLACVVVVLMLAAGMYLVARLYFGVAGGWLGAAAALYLPYFAVDLYVRSAMEELVVFAFIGFVLYGFGGYARQRRAGLWVLGVAAYAAVLCCHFPAALLFSPLVAAFLGFTAWMEKSWKVLWKQAAGLACGLGVSAAVWVPAIVERHEVAMNRAVEGHGRYFDHLVYFQQLFDTAWGYGMSVPGPNDGMSFTLGWSHVVLAVVACLWVWRKGDAGARRLVWFFGAAAVVLGGLMLQDARWFWDHVPLVEYVLFPWRLLAPAGICLVLVVAQLGALGKGLAAKWRGVAMTAAMALLVVPNLSHLHAWQDMDPDLAFWTPEQISARGYESTTGWEVTPRWITGLPRYTAVAATVLVGDAQLLEPARTALVWKSQSRATVASTVEMNTAWFPGWEVQVDGTAVAAGPGTPSGLITFQVPVGAHHVEVEFGRAGVEKLAAGISAAALVAALAMAWIMRRQVRGGRAGGEGKARQASERRVFRSAE